MNKKKIVAIIIGITIILLDQLTKNKLVNQNIILVPGFINLTYTENKGVAFGIGSSNIVMVIIVNIIILGFIIKFLKDKNEQVNSLIIISLIFILSGGISNLIDRVCKGFVIDFININLFNFPNFNIADISIVIGILALLISIIISIKNET